MRLIKIDEIFLMFQMKFDVVFRNFNLIFNLAQLILILFNQTHSHLLHRNTTIPHNMRAIKYILTLTTVQFTG